MQWFIELSGWQQALIATTLTWAATALGALAVFFYKKASKNTFPFLLSGAAGIMLASTFFSLLLPALEGGGRYNYIVLTLGFVLGGCLLIGTDRIMEKLPVFQKSQGKKGCAVLCIAVTVHNIPEGLAVGVAFGATEGSVGLLAACLLAIGIAIQNFPEGMCVAFPLRANGFSMGKSFFLGQLSGVVEIIAGLLGALAVSVVSGMLPWALSFSAGAMVAVVCSELIPQSFASSKDKATLGVVLGFALMMLLDVAFG